MPGFFVSGTGQTDWPIVAPFRATCPNSKSGQFRPDSATQMSKAGPATMISPPGPMPP